MLFLAGSVWIFHSFYSESRFLPDIVECNATRCAIEEALAPYFENTDAKEGDSDNRNENSRMKQRKKKVRQLEEKYGVSIVFLTEEDYTEQFQNATKERKVILELSAQENIVGKVFFDGETTMWESVQKEMQEKVFGFFCVIAGGLFIVLLFFYVRYVRPFQKLQEFTTFLAKGQFDVPLKMPKENYFGAFTESFDRMREELKRARQGEYEANLSKKELVAGLSHDIKTPVATIEALCEIIEIQSNEPEMKEKVRIIQNRAKVIDALITDMFHATLEELQMLKVKPQEEYSTEIMPMFSEMNYSGKIIVEGEIKKCFVYMDKLRLNQVIDNIVNNSCKYANTDITVTFSEITEAVCIRIRDYGEGVPDDELPLLTQKYFRGKNGAGKSGSGLGLYLSEQFMKDMGGELLCYNDGGFVAELFLRKV